MRPFDDEGAYPEGRDLVAQRLGEPFQRELRGAVGAEARRGDLTADAGHLDDRAGALGAHVRQDQARQRGGREEMQLEERSQFVLGRFLDRAHRRGVVMTPTSRRGSSGQADPMPMVMPVRSRRGAAAAD
jgi:hypothetical protein